jgi:alpha-tubulin suppressor-like RCC1 family protein
MGSNQYGKLGFPLTVESSSTPKLIDQLSNHRIDAISCGLNHALAVTQDTGVAYSWGFYGVGQLARPVSNDAHRPTAIMSFVKNEIKIKDVSAGGKHSLFLTNNG